MYLNSKYIHCSRVIIIFLRLYYLSISSLWCAYTISIRIVHILNSTAVHTCKVPVLLYFLLKSQQTHRVRKSIHLHVPNGEFGRGSEFSVSSLSGGVFRLPAEYCPVPYIVIINEAFQRRAAVSEDLSVC